VTDPAGARARLVRRFDATMAALHRHEVGRSGRLRLVNVLGLTLVYLQMDWPSPAATALAVGIGGCGLPYLVLHVWRRRRDCRDIALPPLS
jgi:hypothetical protein